MNLYPEMNEKIKGILRTGEAHCLYAAARIEQLEVQLEVAQELCKIYFEIAAEAIGEDTELN